MSNYNTGSGFPDLVRHQRNKNFAVLPRRRGWVDRVLDRATHLIGRARDATLARRGYQVVVSEQIIEYPMVLSHLRPDDHAVLDFGGYESMLPLQLTALGRSVTVLDQRRYPFHHPPPHRCLPGSV